MTNWIETLEVKEDWKLAEKDAITVQEFVKRTLPKLKSLKSRDNILSRIITELELFAGDDDLDGDDFDEIWEKLYNWADYHKVWIRTF